LGNIVHQKVQKFWEGMGLCRIEKPDRGRIGLLVARVSILLIVIYRRCWDCPWLSPNTPCVASYASLHRLRCHPHYRSWLQWQVTLWARSELLTLSQA
jgi:hypothetical protein